MDNGKITQDPLYLAWQSRAVRLVNQAKKDGLLPDLSTGEYACVDCGLPAFYYEHRDYTRPLDVEPVCPKCNSKRGPSAAVTPRNFKRLNSMAGIYVATNSDFKRSA